MANKDGTGPRKRSPRTKGHLGGPCGKKPSRKGKRPSSHVRRVKTKKGRKAVRVNPKIKKRKKVIKRRTKVGSLVQKKKPLPITLLDEFDEDTGTYNVKNFALPRSLGRKGGIKQLKNKRDDWRERTEPTMFMVNYPPKDFDSLSSDEKNLILGRFGRINLANTIGASSFNVNGPFNKRTQESFRNTFDD